MLLAEVDRAATFLPAAQQSALITCLNALPAISGTLNAP
jgi:hypothetical protein